jgi:prepilin-type N-terminal cleavage/methylation domain-containing protein
MPKDSSIKTNGYTLIEILVAITIIVIIFGVGLLNFRDFSRRQSLSSFARQVKGDLSLARENAVSGEKPASVFCSLPNTLDGYSFRLESDTNYVIEAVCSGGDVEVKSVDLPLDLSIEAQLESPILFKVLSRGTNLSGDVTITLNQNKTGNSYNVYVTKAGEVK